MDAALRRRVIAVGLLVGFLLNLTGWLGNNFMLGGLWQDLQMTDAYRPWRDSPWRDLLSLLPDFIYGWGIAWLCAAMRPTFRSWVTCALASGAFVALMGGVTTYFAIANSALVPWRLAFASFALVILTKMPFALLAGRLLEPRSPGAERPPQP